MAEQEACATAVTEALAAAGEAGDGGDGDARGESLLLPLLQGLLGGGGERLLAGLGAAGADVVADVRRSLARLRAALAPPTDHPQARALLTLADRLEDALAAADRLDGCRRRPRRRSRAARHTVGVTHEELAQARRLVDRDQLALDEPPAPLVDGASTASTASIEDTPTPERKQSIEDEVSFHDAVASRKKPAPIAHSASFVDTPKVNRDARVVERRAAAPRKPDFFRHSIADAGQVAPLTPQLQQPQQPQPVYQQPQQPISPQVQQFEAQQQTRPVYQQPQQPISPQVQQFEPQQQSRPMYQPKPQAQPQFQSQPLPTYRRPSDTKSGIAKIANKFDNQAKENVIPSSFPRRAPVERRRSPPPVSAPTITAKPASREEQKRVPLYKPLPPTYNFAAPPTTDDFSKPLNRFGNNKRARMKRANTIDIGKPLGGYSMDSDTDEDSRGPNVPKFQPQTENDKKFVAFMRKNEENQVTVNGQTNWTNRFGNIKNTFESRERDDHSRSSSGSSARRFWRAAEESPSPSATRPRKFLNDVSNNNIVKPPWVTERRNSKPHIAPQVHIPQMPPSHPPPVPQSPTRPIVVKPFVAKPIPVNQFSHAPMSAFKPPAKVTSPINAPTHIWSPPSLSNTVSPTVEAPQPLYSMGPKTIPSPPIQNVPWMTNEQEKPRKVVTHAPPKFDAPPPAYKEHHLPNPPTPPTHAHPQVQSYPVKSIPSQNNLAAPELVKRIDDAKPYEASSPYIPKVDAQKLQIQFYEKQIRQRGRIEPMTNGHNEHAVLPQRKPPAPSAYTITDYTPNNVISTFVPLQQTPDIEKARAHKVDYLPDVVLNEGERNNFPQSPITQSNQQPGYRAWGSPYTSNKQLQGHQNGETTLVDGLTTEHGSVETRVMRGPVRGAATITAGVRTRNDEYRRGGAADNLKGVLDKIPKNEVLTHIEKKKRENSSNQVRVPVQNGLSPLHASPNPRLHPANEYGSAPHSPAGGRSPALAASRESVLSSESAASVGSSPLSRSGSWHQLAERTQKSSSPRKVVARAKSMHLLAVPKLFEGGIARDELTEKKKTVEAYFSGQAAAPAAPVTTVRPQQHAAGVRARAARSQTQYSLGRSRTMPTVSELQFLDESNADDAFEDLVSALA